MVCQCAPLNLNSNSLSFKEKKKPPDIFEFLTGDGRGAVPILEPFKYIKIHKLCELLRETQIIIQVIDE